MIVCSELRWVRRVVVLRRANEVIGPDVDGDLMSARKGRRIVDGSRFEMSEFVSAGFTRSRAA